MCELKFDSFTEYISAFSTEQGCIDYLEQIRWKGDVRCPFCIAGSPYKFKNSNNYKCSDNRCNKKFNVKIGTIFECTKLPLVKWFQAIYIHTSHKKGISSCQLARDLGITQKSAWFMLHRIRRLYGAKPELLQGVIEVDETFVGGKNKNRHRDKKFTYNQGRSYKDKTPVLGILERGTKRVVTKVVIDTKRVTIEPIVFSHVKRNSTIMSDEWWAYRKMYQRYEHYFIDHGKGQYADGDVHTNTIEGFWSHLKRGIIGIYHNISRKHLQAYCDEFAFRYNTCRSPEYVKILEAFSNMENRVTYQELVG